MRLFAGKDETDLSTEEAAACAAFRKSTIVLYLNCLDGGAAWTTLIRSAVFLPSSTCWHLYGLGVNMCAILKSLHFVEI